MILKNVSKKQLLLVVFVVFVFLIVIILLLLSRGNNSSQTNITGTNPLIESYRNQLPQLAETAKDNNNATAIRNYAVALYATGDLEGAKEQYVKEKELNPNDPVLYNNLGNIYRDSGEYQLAVESYQKSIDLDKAQLNVYVNLANLYIYVLQKPDLGYGVYLKGIENSPNNRESLLLQLANAYKDGGETQKAIETYNKILEINPNNTSVRNILNSLNN